MWLASPAFNVDDDDLGYLNVVVFDGYISNVQYNSSNYGLRPVVCLKSTVDVTLNDNGTVTLVSY